MKLQENGKKNFCEVTNMIKIINETKCDNQKPLLRMQLQYTYDRLHVDRSESSFGGKPALTRKEIQHGNNLVEQSRQITAW